jgi:Xaa-Pro aminopeptidase
VSRALAALAGPSRHAEHAAHSAHSAPSALSALSACRMFSALSAWRMFTARSACVALAAISACRLGAQPVLTNIFPLAEFAARRAAVMQAIGDGVAIVQGAIERPGEQPFRQNNQFFYLFGPVTQPRVIGVIDGRTKRATLYLNRDGRDRSYGVPSLVPGDSAATTAGVDAVVARDSFATAVAQFAREQRAVFTPFRAEVLGFASSGDASGQARATKMDPWDGRGSREDAFVEKLKASAPAATVRNLDPIVDGLRGTKSAREIAVIREATRMTGLGIMEAMRDARPGMVEYELQADAEFVFKKFGAYGPAYFALIMAGPNSIFTHYHRNTSRLVDGELVEFDYAPDYKYYVSDVTRVFPANGKFTPVQREAYTIYLRLYQALMTSIKVHASGNDIIKAAVVKMDSLLASFRFQSAPVKAAATRFVDTYRNSRSNSLGHTIGLEVHDVRNPTQTMEPGQIFTIEPQMNVPEEHFGIRLEDVLLITPTGYENLSGFVPIEIADIEKLMAQPGLSDAALKPPPLPPPPPGGGR